MEKRLYTLKEFSKYISCGMTKAREIAKNASYCVRIGNRIYIDRIAFDAYLTECREKNIAL